MKKVNCVLSVFLLSFCISLCSTTSSTVIIVEDAKACFRRALAGKRIIDTLIRKAVSCERVEDCQRECNDEKRFVCEGFNYRLDPSGRAQGDCELLDIPLSRLDLRRDVLDDPEYDFYEKDRNNDAPDCRGIISYGSYGNRVDTSGAGSYGGNYYHSQDKYDRRYDFYDDRGYGGYYADDYRGRPRYDGYDYGYDSRYDGNRRGDDYWRKYFKDRVKDKNYWGFDDRRNGWGTYGGSYGNFGAPDSYYGHDRNEYRNTNRYDYEKKYFYIPPDDGTSKDWGRYGGSYGNGDAKWNYHNRKNGYEYWGFNRLNGGDRDRPNDLLPPYQDRPQINGQYLPPFENTDYFDIQRRGQHDHHHHHDFYDYFKNECSLRAATGFRLHKGVVRKLVAVPNIYECELLCFKERDFLCNAYAFRYTSLPNSPPENCYLSERDYRELDYYTDLEPDRDCDIYTMNNQKTCDQSVHLDKLDSDCFWRIRSGQRLDQRIVRDSLNVKTIVDCQVECLRGTRFICRAFSFRYGSPVIGGAIDNCQLTDWPYLDMNPRTHLVPEEGFELYDRGSYGHGCEPNHFYVGRKPSQDPPEQLNQLCYIGYGSPARLLPQATKKSLPVESEEQCRTECTKAREKSIFQCMSFSYRTKTPKGSPNCDLSDIVQRDLLSNVDYVADPDSWLFAWDISSPQCLAAINSVAVGSGTGATVSDASGGALWSGTLWGIGGGSGGGVGNSIDDNGGKDNILIPWISPGHTWRIYSVGGMPCRKDSLCQENKVAGFWYCELEGKEEHAWDYCCRPDHQCGYSQGFPYQWCYVGPEKSQWRKCNEKYYPYAETVHDRFDLHHSRPYLPDHNGWASNHISDPKRPYRPSFRPDRPSITVQDDYDNPYLDPPKPGGFGTSRYWPISYLHKESPPSGNESYVKNNSSKTARARNIDSKYDAIANLISVIKSNDDPRSRVSSNSSSKSNDVLHVNIPLASNFSRNTQSEKFVQPSKSDDIQLEVLDLIAEQNKNVKTRLSNAPLHDQSSPTANNRGAGMYTRSYITRTNRSMINQMRAKAA